MVLTYSLEPLQLRAMASARHRCPLCFLLLCTSAALRVTRRGWAICNMWGHLRQLRAKFHIKGWSVARLSSYTLPIFPDRGRPVWWSSPFDRLYPLLWHTRTWGLVEDTTRFTFYYITFYYTLHFVFCTILHY